MKLAFVLGIRPDVIRASLILNKLENIKEFEVDFIWSGQHYSDNLKDLLSNKILELEDNTNRLLYNNTLTNINNIRNTKLRKVLVFLAFI